MSEACSIHSVLHDVALDVQAEDVARVLARLRLVCGQLHAAGLAAPADQNLRLDDHWVADLVGRGYGLIDGRDWLAG